MYYDAQRKCSKHSSVKTLMMCSYIYAFYHKIDGNVGFALALVLMIACLLI